MIKFEFLLKNEKEKIYNLISWIIIITNLAFFVYMSAATGFKKFGPIFYTLFAILSIIIPRYFKNRNENPGLSAPYMIVALGWTNSSSYWWVSIIIVVFIILDGAARRQLIVKVFSDRIIYPSWPKKEFKWEELNNVILKDCLLTFDFKNNKLYQHEIINSENDYDVKEKEFNDFCNDQLKITVNKQE